MKKRIIAAVLVVVMLVLSLASCGQAKFDFAGAELAECATFDLAAFKEKIAKIVVEDGDFTTNEQTRAEKVLENIYSSMITNIEKNVASDESLKNTEAAISLRDVLYYNYYCTATINEKDYVFYSSAMESALTADSTKKVNHTIKLPVVDKDDELDVALKAAIAALTDPTMKDFAYSTDSTKGTTIKKGDTVVLSYKVTYTQTVDTENQKVETTVNYSAPIVLDDTTDFGKKFFEEKSVVSVGNEATFGEDKSKSFTVTENDIEKTYSNVTVKWVVKDAGAELVTFKHTLFGDDVDKDTNTKVKDDRTNVEIDLKGVELTYHVYPVYAVSIPEIDATTIIRDALGTSITTHSMLLFENENYTAKDGDKNLTFEELIEALTEAYTERDNKQKAYDTAKSAVEKAGDKATEEQKKAETDAKAALETAKKTVNDKITLIVTATSSKTEDKGAAEAIVESYKNQVYSSLKGTYDKDITEKVGKEVYKAMKDTVKITKYPQAVVDELWHVYYERYEYLFWNEKKEGTSYSNYKYYNGVFADYLAAELGAKATGGDLWGGVEGINKKLTQKVEKALEPIIIIYTVSKEFSKDTTVLTDLEKWIKADIEAGIFESSYEVHRHDYESDEDYNKAVEEAKKNKEEAEKDAVENAKTFLYDNAAYDAYVKEIGDNYNAMVDGYMMYGLIDVPGIGDIGLRATVQTNKLLGYLMSPVYTWSDVMEQSEVAYKDVNGTLVVDFHNPLISYTAVEEIEDEADDKDDDKDDNKDDAEGGADTQ